VVISFLTSKRKSKVSRAHAGAQSHQRNLKHSKTQSRIIKSPLFASPIMHIFLMIVSLLVVFFLTFAPHLETTVPLHVDEWHHITQAKELLNDEYTITLSSLRIGFHMFLAVFDLVLGVFDLDLVEIYYILPAIWAVLSALCLYVLLSYFHLNIYAKILGIVSFGTIFSNINVLGIQTFVGSTFVIPFVFLFLYFALVKNVYANIFFGLLILGCYPVALLFFFPLLFFIPGTLFSRWFFGILLLASITFTAIFFSFKYKINGWLLFVFSKEWLTYERFYFPTEMFSWFALILAVIGLYFISKKYVDGYLFIHAWLYLGVLFILMQFAFYGTIFVPYVRALYYGVLVLPILVAFGFMYIENFLPNFKVVFILVVIGILGLTQPYPSDDVIFLPIFVDQFAYDTYSWFATQEKGKVLADRPFLLPLYIYSGQKPAIPVYYANATPIEQMHSSLYGYCDVREDYIKKQRVSYVRLHKDRPCTDWVELFRTSGNYVYDVRHISMPNQYRLVDGVVVAK
jgi:hypothetical protein